MHTFQPDDYGYIALPDLQDQSLKQLLQLASDFHEALTETDRKLAEAAAQKDHETWFTAYIQKNAYASAGFVVVAALSSKDHRQLQSTGNLEPFEATYEAVNGDPGGLQFFKKNARYFQVFGQELLQILALEAVPRAQWDQLMQLPQDQFDTVKHIVIQNYQKKGDRYTDDLIQDVLSTVQ